MKDYRQYILLTRFKATSFDTKEDAFKHAERLENVGYQVKVFCKHKTLQKDRLTLLHETSKFEKRSVAL